MSGLVRVKYCKAPTMLLYRVASLGPNRVPSKAESFSLVESGVLTGLQQDILTLLSKSEAYLSWVKIKPPATLLTSIPRK
jgi:hypothetical protein